MISPLAPDQRDSAARQEKPGVDVLTLPDVVLDNHLLPALRQVDALDAFALTSRPANRAVTQWRVRENLKEIAAGLVFKVPEALDEPAQGAIRATSTPPEPLGRQGAALRALQRMHRFLNTPRTPFELEALRQEPMAPPAQLMACLENLRAGASARMDVGSIGQRGKLLGRDFQTLRDHYLLPLCTWAFENRATSADPIAVAGRLLVQVFRHDARLDLAFRQIESVPPIGAYYDRLQVAWLHTNHFVKIPKEILLFEHLEVLNLSFNKLDELPYELAHLQKLRTLYLEGNALSTLSPVIFGLKSLEQLTLNANAIVDVADDCAFSSSLQEISIDNVSLSALGPALSRSSGLKKVSIGCRDDEQQLSGDMGMLHGVEALTIRTKSATTLPAELGNLRALKALDVFSESLRQLPEEMGALHELERVKLYAPRLSKLPQALVLCQKLQILDLRLTNVAPSPTQIRLMPNLNQLLMPWDIR